MKTIGCGLVQFPIMRCYRFLVWKFSLTTGAIVVAWQLIFQCTLRLVLLSAWGMENINYNLPVTDGLMWGVYTEMGLLAFQVANAMIMIIGIWAGNLLMVYPTLLIIPVCLVIDFALKIAIYPYLFLTPVVTVFGIFTMIDIWFRAIVFTYSWIVILSYVYYKRKYDLGETLGSHVWLTKLEKSASMSSNTPMVTSPFSRSSTLSRIGRHSFLLKSGRRYKNTKHLHNESDASEMTLEAVEKLRKEKDAKDEEDKHLSSSGSQTPSSCSLSTASNDHIELAPLVHESGKYDTMHTSISQQMKPDTRNREIVQRPSKLIKRGFVPDILKGTDSFKSTPGGGRTSTRQVRRPLLEKDENKDVTEIDIEHAPTLPRKSPVGVNEEQRAGNDRIWSWLSPGKPRSTSSGSQFYSPVSSTIHDDHQQSFLI